MTSTLRRPYYDELEHEVDRLREENVELREKYARALNLLRLYKSRAELCISKPRTKMACDSPSLAPDSPVHSPDRNGDLLSRYLEITQARRSSEQPLRSLSPKARKTNMWRERLLRMNSISPRKDSRSRERTKVIHAAEEVPHEDELHLAEKLNSGKFNLPDPPESPGEISELLSHNDY